MFLKEMGQNESFSDNTEKKFLLLRNLIFFWIKKSKHFDIFYLILKIIYKF